MLQPAAAAAEQAVLPTGGTGALETTLIAELATRLSAVLMTGLAVIPISTLGSAPTVVLATGLPGVPWETPAPLPGRPRGGPEPLLAQTLR